MYEYSSTKCCVLWILYLIIKQKFNCKVKGGGGGGKMQWKIRENGEKMKILANQKQIFEHGGKQT
jgi:hypothetical protein